MFWSSTSSRRRSSYDSSNRRNSATSTASSTAVIPARPTYSVSPTLPESTTKASYPMGDQYRRPSLSAVSPNANLSVSPIATTTATYMPYSHSDLYTVNSLNSFSFGNASTSSPSSASPISPLDDEDERSPHDVTPRPSVVDKMHSPPTHTSRPSRSHSSQNVPGHSKEIDSSDTASHRTFGTSSASTSAASLTPSNNGVEFDDYMYYSDEERIEISSVLYDGSTIDIDDRRYSQPVASSFASGFGERRVSLPIAVPEGRDREGSVITLRRPSKSLEQDSPITIVTRANDPNSLPESDGDWKSLRARTKGKTKDTVPSSSTHNPPAPPPPTKLTAPPIMTQDFDLDWNNITQGITSFDQPAYANHQSDARRGSSNSIFSPWTRRPSTATTASLFSNDDPFARALKHWNPDYRDQTRAWTFSRERADGPGPGLSPTSPSSRRGRASLGDTSKFGVTSTASASNKEKDPSRSTANWKGMAVGSQEIWANELVGRFKVNRRATVKQDEGGEASSKPAHRLTIEHFRDAYTRSQTKHNDPIIHVHKHSKTVAFSISRYYRTTGQTRSTMSATTILLAPRNVQQAYTSTTSTRKLASHGLLEEDKHHRSGSSKKSFDPQSSGGSVSSSSSRPTSSSGSAHPRRVRKPSFDSDDDAPPPRTPHSEAYGTVDAAQLDQLRHSNFLNSSDDGPSFFSKLLRPKRSELPAQRMVVYNPGWVTLEPRNKQEQTQRVVENLNHSFQEVGLLQPINKPRGTKSKDKSRRKAHPEGENWLEIFGKIPEEVLFMLLPLWPSDTDPLSATAEGPFPRPQVERQYLLVCYKPNLVHSAPAKRVSPTSSSESKERDEKNILVHSYDISGRLVAHNDIQGSGMRVSEGITVNGSLRDAYAKMPPPITNTTTELIGTCRSREAGVEFFPDGLVNLGLCLTYNAYPPGTIQEEAEEQGKPRPVIELTPVGRAVVQMAWVGGMALSSFGPQTLSKV